MRSFLGVTCALMVSVGGGYALTSQSLGFADRLSRENIGGWSFWPEAGSPEADPYLRAILATSAALPMAAGEGVSLVATEDEQGQALDSRCDYRITGRTPVARMATISVYDEAGRVFSTPSGRSHFTGDELLRNEDGVFSVDLSSEARPGNWLPLEDGKRFRVILRLYDTPLGANAAALNSDALPKLQRAGCR